MSIVGGLDIHRKQLTFDYLDTATGQVTRGAGRAPADRSTCGPGSPGSPGATTSRSRSRAYRVAVRRREAAAAGTGVHLAEPTDTAFARGRKRHAKTDKTDSRHLRQLLAEGKLPEVLGPAAQVLGFRALLEAYHDLRREHRLGAAHPRGVLPPGREALGEEITRTAEAWTRWAPPPRPVGGRAAAVTSRWPYTCLENGSLCAPAAGHRPALKGARSGRADFGVGPVPRWRYLLAGRKLLLRPQAVRFVADHPVTRDGSDPGRLSRRPPSCAGPSRPSAAGPGPHPHTRRSNRKTASAPPFRGPQIIRRACRIRTTSATAFAAA